MNVGVHIFIWIVILFALGIYLEVELLDHMLDPFLEETCV